MENKKKVLLTGSLLAGALLATANLQANAADMITVSSAGYKAAGFPAVRGFNKYPLDRTGDLDPVVLDPGKKNNSWLAWIAIAAVVYKVTEKKKAVSKIDNGTLTTIGVGLLLWKGFGLISDLIDSLGIGEGAAGDEQTNPQSPWKPAYLDNIPAGTSYLALTVAAGQQFSYDIYHAFRLLYDDWETIFGIFSKLKTKSQVSSLAKYFYDAYKVDLLTFLTNGGGILPWDGLSKAHMKTLTDLVDNLPKYKV